MVFQDIKPLKSALSIVHKLKLYYRARAVLYIQMVYTGECKYKDTICRTVIV